MKEVCKMKKAKINPKNRGEKSPVFHTKKYPKAKNRESRTKSGVPAGLTDEICDKGSSHHVAIPQIRRRDK